MTDLFVSTEGLVGRSQPGERVLTFASDMCIAELVDERNQPVSPGAASSKLLVTNLHNHTQPLIRYELTDQFAEQPAAGNGHLRAIVGGRADTVFRYGKLEVSPFPIRSAFATAPAVREYQIRQTPRGIDVLVVVDGQMDAESLIARLDSILHTVGIHDAEVTIRRVDSIEPNPQTGKTRRFIALTT